MATIRKRVGLYGDVTYTAMVRKTGHKPQTKTFAKAVDAKRWAYEIEKSMDAGTFLTINESKRHTLSDAVERYIKSVLPRKCTKMISDQKVQLGWFSAEMGHLTLSQITPAILVELRDKLSHSGKSNSTVNRYLAALSHCLTIAAKEWQWLETSPMNKLSKLKEPRGRTRYLSDEERKALLNACKNSVNPELYTIVVLALTTGARHSEILSLWWTDINFDAATATFRHTKNGEIRTVPLASTALDVLRDKQASRWAYQEPTDKRVFISKDFSGAWNTARREAGIEDFRFHDLRHSAASYLAMSGASLLEIAAILGHKTLSMVKRYSHLSDTHLSSVVERMQNKFEIK